MRMCSLQKVTSKWYVYFHKIFCWFGKKTLFDWLSKRVKTFGWLKYFKELSRTRLKRFSNTQPIPECTSLISCFEHSKWSNIRVSPHKALRILGILRILEILSDTHPLHPAPLTRLHSQSDAPLYSTDNPPTLTIETSIYLIRIAKGPTRGRVGKGGFSAAGLFI